MGMEKMPWVTIEAVEALKPHMCHYGSQLDFRKMKEELFPGKEKLTAFDLFSIKPKGWNYTHIGDRLWWLACHFLPAGFSWRNSAKGETIWWGLSYYDDNPTEDKNSLVKALRAHINKKGN